MHTSTRGPDRNRNTLPSSKTKHVTEREWLDCDQYNYHGSLQPLKSLLALLACGHARCCAALDCFRRAHHGPDFDHWSDVRV